MVKKGAKASKGATQRQSTFGPQESDILTAIDEKFEDLEETIILASLVPQLHHRLSAVEQLLKIPNNLDLNEGVMQIGPKWGEKGSPQRKAPPDDDVQSGMNLEGENNVSEARFGVEQNISDLTAMSPLKRRDVKRVTEISKAKVKEIDEKTLDTQTSEYYTFGESTWDLVVFIGTGALGPLGSVQTVLLAVVNVLMQVVFCAIAYYNFTTPDMDDNSIVDTLRWRRSSGHSFGDYSTVAKESLVHRVCKLDKSLESSGIQVALLENINKYLKLEAEGLEGFFTGQILCIVALICWYLMVAKEVSHALALHRGIMAMPRGPTKLDTRENPFTQAVHYRLRAVAFRRKIFSGVLLLYRLVAAVLLVVVGTSFLVYTVSVTELILNAVALGIILDIDDLLFDALATTPGRHLVHQLDPLPMPSMPRIRGADAKSVFMSFFIPALTIFVYFTMLEPFVGTLTGLKTAMCGGNQNFVWSMDKRRITHLAPTFGGGWEEEEGSIKTDAIVEGETIGYGLSINATRYGVWLTDVTVLGEMDATSLEDLVENSNPTCGDLANAEPMLNYLRYLLGNESIQSCADVTPYCNSFTKMPEFAVDGGIGFSARMLCAESCGCQESQGEFINVQGCPYDQCMRTSAFQSSKESGLCIEKNASSLADFGPWKAWIQKIRSYGEQTTSILGGKPDALILAKAMEDNGCGFIANLSAQNISLGGCFTWNSKFTWEFKTLEAFCPITCGCSTENSAKSRCPQPFGMTCDSVLSSCLTYRDQHFCSGYNVERVNGLIMYTFASADAVTANKAEMLLAFKVAFAQLAGHTVPIDPDTVRMVHAWNGAAYSYNYLTDSTMNATEISQSLYSASLADYQAVVDASLSTSGVTLSDLGLSLTWAGAPTGPYGSYGYQDYR